VLVTLETYDLQANKFVTLMAADCAFGYRTSRFKSADKGRFFITGITIRLEHGMAQPPYYRDIQAYIEQNKVTDITLASLRDIVSHIREKKLPDPRIIPNTGSFFQNPIISKEAYQTIVENHPQIEKAPMGWSQPPRWFLDNEQVKLSAGWLVEQAGFKAYEDKETGMATWPYQNLVLTNKGAHSTADLLKFKQKIIDAVQAKFGVALVQEPELIGA